jgi:hypothetical protein
MATIPNRPGLRALTKHCVNPKEKPSCRSPKNNGPDSAGQRRDAPEERREIDTLFSVTYEKLSRLVSSVKRSDTARSLRGQNPSGRAGGESLARA